MRTLKGAVAVVMMVMVACLGFAGVGSAEPRGLSIGGTLGGFDCQTGKLTMVISGATTYIQATDQSAAYLDGSPIALCSLEAYTGSPAAARLVPTHSGYFLDEINVGTTSPEALLAPQSAPVVSSGSSALGVALGAVIGGAIGYLLGKN